MSSDLMIPMNEVTRADAAQDPTFADVLPQKYLPKGDNYADNAEVLADIQQNLVPLIQQTRIDRAGLTESWQAIRRMEAQIHDAGQKFRGRSNAYLPVYSRLLATQTSTLAKGIFPSDEYMDCVDRSSQDPERARGCKAYVQWEFERNAKIRKNMKVFLRQLKAYGNSPLKYLYRKELKREGRRFNVNGESHGAFAKISYEGLQVSARSLFNWYVYPMTADSLEEATLVFEDIEMPRAYIEAQLYAKRWKNGEEALRAAPVPEVDSNRADLHATAFGVNHANTTGGSLAQILTLTEAWTFLKLPKSAYVEGEDHSCPVPVMVVLAGSTPLCVIRNPYYHQRPPYLFGSLNRHPGMIYGYGVGHLSKSMQYLTNDFANQTNDCGAYILNPIIALNPSHVAGPLRPIAPGVVWNFTDVDKGMRFERPPFELIQHGLNMTSLYMGWTQDLGGAPPAMSGISGGANKTATGMQILQRNAMSPLQDEVEDIEQDVMIPLMYGTWYNGQQFRQGDIRAVLAGQDITIEAASLAIDAEFRWLASSQAVNSQQRNQQLMQFIQMTAPLVPLLNQQGYVVDFGPLLQRALGDGMGVRGIGQIIRRAEMAGPPGMPVPPEAQAGVQAEQGDRARSALEQAAGGGTGDIVPGEAEAFMDAREEADMLAAEMGAMYGQG